MVIAACASLIADAGASEDPGPAPPDAVVAYTVEDGRRIADSLTGSVGVAARGLKLYAGDGRTGCIRCHGLPDAPGLRGDAVAATAHRPRRGVPALDRVGSRIDPGQIRLWLVAPDFLGLVKGKTSLYAAGQRGAPDDPLFGGPRLTAAEIEDLVAWLSGLTGTD